MQIPKQFSDKLSQDKIDKIVEVCKAVKITNPVHLMAVMFFESGRTFNPAITNTIGSVGLIQFTRDKAGVQYKTIRGKRYQLADLKKMTFLQQMDVVAEYYKEAGAGKTLSTFIDVYLVTFFPLALGKGDSFVFETKNLTKAIIARQNPAFDANKDGQIKKGEVVKYFEGIYKKWGFDTSIITSGGIGLLGAAVAVFFYTGYTAGLSLGLI